MSQPMVGGRYRILRELGRGGTATVYLARDEKQDREVAIKVLHPALATVVGPGRFLREIAVTAALNHPHILPLLDSGADDGILYYVMPHVTGGSLRGLQRAGAVPLEAVNRIAREVASALDYAHARGILHRDIKPENILFSEGLAVVADFGIARALGGDAASRLTGTALPVGTLGYMSPEQALGTAELDARTDVYSLGCVVYELLLGGTPAAWPDARDVELGRFSDLAAGHRERLDALPGRVEQVLVRALALRPQHRYASAGELATALLAASQLTARFSDEEVRELLRRAAELDALVPEAPVGLTMGGVEQIAAQVGIPPVHVREAASALARTEPLPVESGAAGPRWDRLVATGTAAGEITPDIFPAMADEIQRRLGMLGHTSILGATLTWSPAAQGENARRVLVQVSARDGVTSVRVQEELELEGIRRGAIPIGGLCGIAMGAAWGQLLGLADAAVVLMVPLGFLGIFSAVRAIIWADARGRAPQIQQLAEALLALARTSIESARPLPGSLPAGSWPRA